MSTKQASETTEVDISKLTPEDVAKLAERLEKDDYDDPFAGLKDWHLLRSLAFNRAELIEGYYHLLDMEEYDEC
jgi:hypothetical protein